MDEQWWEFEIDLSGFTYPDFLAFFFDRPVVGEENEYYLFRTEMHSFGASNPGVVVGHLQEMCQHLAELTTIYSQEQLEQGLWAMFGAGISCEQFLFDSTVNIGLRTGCIESMCLPFSNVVARSTTDVRNSFYWMWWDMILDTFWGRDSHDYTALDSDRKQIAEAVYQTLLKILALNHRGCQWCALHGLGHLHHPAVRDTVQAYLDIHKNEFTEDELEWVEACRDGRNP